MAGLLGHSMKCEFTKKLNTASQSCSKTANKGDYFLSPIKNNKNTSEDKR